MKVTRLTWCCCCCYCWRQVLDVGRCSSLWRLPSSLLRLSLLQRLVVPSKAIAQVGAPGLRCLLLLLLLLPSTLLVHIVCIVQTVLRLLRFVFAGSV